MIISPLVKKLSFSLEYTCFSLCLFYWFFYSLARVRGVPVLFSGIQINSILPGIIVLVVLLFNAVFFSRLFVELGTGTKTVRAELATLLFRRVSPLFLVLIVIALVTGGRFDFASYKLQWSLIIGGGNPWGFVEGGMVNAYGYVFNFLAILYSVHPLLPKIFFVLLLLVFCLRLTVSQSSSGHAHVLILCINPFTVSTIAVYGFIDGMCSILLGFALLEASYRDSRSFLKAGVFLALSVLTKFYSLVSLPLLLLASLKSRSFQVFAIGYLLTSIIVIVGSFALWGDSILAPLLFAKGRDPSFLTIWKYVSHPELRTVGFSIASVIAVAWGCSRKNLSCSYRTVAVLSIVFGTYYLGHQQFYLGILAAMAVYVFEVSRDVNIQMKKPVLWSFALMFGWLVFVQTGFELFDEFKPIGLDDLLPFLSFVNSMILVASGCFWLSTKPTTVSRVKPAY